MLSRPIHHCRCTLNCISFFLQLLFSLERWNAPTLSRLMLLITFSNTAEILTHSFCGFRLSQWYWDQSSAGLLVSLWLYSNCCSSERDSDSTLSSVPEIFAQFSAYSAYLIIVMNEFHTHQRFSELYYHFDTGVMAFILSIRLSIILPTQPLPLLSLEIKRQI